MKTCNESRIVQAIDNIMSAFLFEKSEKGADYWLNVIYNLRYELYSCKQHEGNNEMGNIKEIAQAFEPKQTRNIVELDKVSIDTEIKDVEYTKEDGETFTVHEIVVDGEAFRVPTSVIAQLKAQLESKPDMEYFKVTKKGEGMKTAYTVIVL